jgi:hypothetical protein
MIRGHAALLQHALLLEQHRRVDDHAVADQSLAALQYDSSVQARTFYGPLVGRGTGVATNFYVGRAGGRGTARGRRWSGCSRAGVQTRPTAGPRGSAGGRNAGRAAVIRSVG